ncbi:MAG: hypothetical protein KF716_08875 [Anaerolineae bacterium]|nr:hypothetical protein [Anaerolineae bacterium]
MVSRVEKAKLSVIDLKVEGAEIVRFTVNVWEGFGCMVKATADGYSRFVDAIAALGLDAEMHKYALLEESKLEPVYGYEVFIHVPVNWNGR